MSGLGPHPSCSLLQPPRGPPSAAGPDCTCALDSPPTPTPSGTLGLPQKCRILQGLLEVELLCRGMVGGERGNADSLFTAEGPLLT